MLTGPRPPLDDIDLALTRAAVRRGLFGERPEPYRVGRFEISGRLGVGGMGRVYRAHDPQLDRMVALKLIAASDESDLDDRQAQRDRLIREARALAKLAHQNVVAVFEAGTAGADVYIAMEYVVGRDLRAWMVERHPWSEVAGLLAQAGRGLAAAHAAGIVHRDFKPENVLIGDDGRVRVADFGLARPGPSERERTEEMATLESRIIDLGSATRTGAQVGTPAYLAPEQWEGALADARSDQYSFCVTAYEVLSGRRPGKDGPAVGDLAGVPQAVQRAILRGLEPNPELRHPSMSALVDALAAGAEPRRPIWAGAGLITLALLGVAAVGWYAVNADERGEVVRADPCAGFDRQLAAVWDADAQARLVAAFDDAERPYLVTVGRSVDAALARYAAAWVDARTETCRATRERDEQSEQLRGLRAACLEQRRLELRTTVELLSEAGSATLERAPAMIASLTPLSSCSDVATLRRRHVVDSTPEQLELVARADSLLTRATTRLRAGHYERAREDAEAALGFAEGPSFEPLRGRTLLIRGIAEVELGDPRGERTLRDAVWSAEASGEDTTAADAWIRIAGLIGDERSEPEAAADELERASAAVARSGDAKLEGELLRLRARLEVRAGEYEDALELLSRARSVYADSLAPDHPDQSALLETIGNTNFRLGRYADAAASFEAAIEIKAGSYGRGHPRVAGLLGNLATTMVMQGQNAEAIPLFEEAIVISKAAAGPGRSPKNLGDLLNGLGAANDQLGRDAEALTTYRRALEVASASNAADHPTVLSARTNIARVLGRLERYAEAEAELEAVLELRIESQGADHPAVAEPLNSLASLALAQGHADRAVELNRRALALRRASLGDEHVLTALSHHNLGEALEQLERFADARREAELAVGILTRADGVNPSYLGLATLALARDELGLGRHAPAERHARAALSILEEPGGVDHAWAVFILARSLARSDPAQALAEAGRAQDLLGPQCDDARELCDAIAQWLAAATADSSGE